MTERVAVQHVPFINLKAPYLELKEGLDAAYSRVMESGWYILGEEVERFEAEFAAYCEARFCISVGNGLEALHLILRGYGIGPGDEVIVPSNTYIASWLAVSYAGATPVPVEPDPRTYNLDPDRIEASITSRTQAIMPVHLYGQPADIDPIMELANHYGLKVVDDAAQAQGTRYKGKTVGKLCDAAGFSFYPTKNLGAMGDAGAVVTDDELLADRVRLLRNYGSRVKYDNEIKGFNSRLDPLQAAFLRVKLPFLDEWNDRRRKVAQFYQEHLAGVPDLTLPYAPEWAEPIWHVYAVCHPERDRLQKHLAEEGISTLIHYPVPPHLSQAYQEMGYRPGDFPIAEEIANTILSIPMGPHLSFEEAGRVVDSLSSFPR